MLDALCNFVSGVQKFEISYIRCQCHSKLSQNNFKSDDKFGQQFDIRIFFCKKKTYGVISMQNCVIFSE